MSEFADLLNLPLRSQRHAAFRFGAWLDCIDRFVGHPGVAPGASTARIIPGGPPLAAFFWQAPLQAPLTLERAHTLEAGRREQRQKDTDTLPEYDVLDAILAGYIERYESAATIAANFIALCIAFDIVLSTYFVNPVWHVMQNAMLFD